MLFSQTASIIDSNGTYLKKNAGALNTYVDGSYIRFLNNNNTQYAYALKPGKYVCCNYTSNGTNIIIIEVSTSATLPYLLINGSTPAIFAL